MRQALVDAGVNIENLVQADVCGMSLTDRVTARTLVQVVALLNADEHAEQLMSTFPVAGVSGTLSGRFGAANAVHARTFVQAKTGTLYTVSSLCGVATRPDGTRLIFAIILNDLGGADALPAAKERVDAAAAAIGEPFDRAECFCCSLCGSGECFGGSFYRGCGGCSLLACVPG